VARHRQRASERKGRRREQDDEPREHLHREDVPGQLDHASGEVDEVEAAIVAGAGGEPEPIDEDDFDEVEEELAANGAPTTSQTRDAAPATAATPAAGRGAPRFLNFLRASWAELQRVQWPDRRQVGQATAVVIGFVVIAGAFLGLIDALAKQVVDLIL
jgi:preprotein translocase subunit SecE